MSSFSDYNQAVITEFRANSGKVSQFNGNLLLLTTTGAKSGKERINPLAYFPDGDRIIIIASKAGAPTNPDWYHNLIAHPQATVEIGTERFPVHAAVADEAERDRLFTQIAAGNPGFAEYQEKTTRKIPIVILERGA